MNYNKDDDKLLSVWYFKLALIKSWLKKYGVENYVIDDKMTINVDGDVDLNSKMLDDFPQYIQFGIVSGYFLCDYNNLTSLRGCPQNVGKDFGCSWNWLKSLEGCPQTIGGSFWCGNNGITSLVGCPQTIGGSFYCDYTRLVNLIGCTKNIIGDLNCHGVQLASFEGNPETIGGNFEFSSIRITDEEKSRFLQTTIVKGMTDQCRMMKQDWEFMEGFIHNIGITQGEVHISFEIYTTDDLEDLTSTYESFIESLELPLYRLNIDSFPDEYEIMSSTYKFFDKRSNLKDSKSAEILLYIDGKPTYE